MSNYNHARFLAESLKAMVEQSSCAAEIIVIDDGSTDDSARVIHSFASKEPKLRFVRNERNMGVLYNANRLLELASGDYVYFGAADDRVLPGLFEKSMRLLAEHPEAALCCSDPAFLDDQTGVIREGRMHLSTAACYFTPRGWSEHVRRRGAWIAGHTAVMKRSALIEAGGFIPELKWHIDWFASLVGAFRHGLCYVPEPLAVLRVLPSSYSAAGIKRESEQREVLYRLMCLLRSDKYRDVRAFFMQSGALSSFENLLLQVIMNHPELWDRETVSFVVSRLVYISTKKCIKWFRIQRRINTGSCQ